MLLNAIPINGGATVADPTASGSVGGSPVAVDEAPAVFVPTEGGCPETDAVTVRANLQIRQVRIKYVRANLAWRTLVPCTEEDDQGEVTGDPGDEPTPEVGCVDTGAFLDAVPVVPGTPVDVIPFTSARFFGMSSEPISALGTLMNGTRLPTYFSWTPGDLAAAFAKGAHVVGTQGGYGQYLLGGVWNLTRFLDVTLARVSPILSVLQARTIDGTYFGYSMIDDFESRTLWPPNGVPKDDLQSACATLKAELPGVRIGIRGRPTQFASNLGFDFYNAQFRQGLGTATHFGTTEYSRALGWGAYTLLDLNYVNGGDGSSGFGSGTRFECTAAEVVSYCTDMFAAADAVDGATKMVGSVGFKYSPPFLGRTGMLAAMTIARNDLASLPALA